jgi:hypothetical protein
MPLRYILVVVGTYAPPFAAEVEFEAPVPGGVPVDQPGIRGPRAARSHQLIVIRVLRHGDPEVWREVAPLERNNMSKCI